MSSHSTVALEASVINPVPKLQRKNNPSPTANDPSAPDHSPPLPPPTPTRAKTPTPKSSILKRDSCLRNIDPRKPKSLVPGLGRSLVPGTQRLDLRLGLLAGVLGGLVGSANVGQLVADAVGDDVRVKGLLLARRDLGVDGLEGEFRGRAAAEPAHELDGRHAGAEV
ncbi:hypothetical protein VTI74DRAFT_1405 [Chaetomium olivicolor]